MHDLNWVEMIGYCGSGLVVVSLMMKSIMKLRWINLTGAIFFVVYGGFIKSNPVIVLNLFIVIADIYHIIRLRKNPERSNPQKELPT